MLTVLSGYDYDLDDELYSNDSIAEIDEVCRLQKKMFPEWFLVCWENTGKPASQKQIYLMTHDDKEQVYDLQNSRWV